MFVVQGMMQDITSKNKILQHCSTLCSSVCELVASSN